MKKLRQVKFSPPAFTTIILSEGYDAVVTGSQRALVDTRGSPRLIHLKAVGGVREQRVCEMTGQERGRLRFWPHDLGCLGQRI